MKKTLASVLLSVFTPVVALSQVTVPSGTKITARLEQTLSSATAEQGQPVQLAVTDAVKLNGVVVIPQGSTVLGTITLAQEKRTMGRTGKLDFSIDKVRAADGEYIPLRYSMMKREGGSKATSTGVITAGVAVVFWPAAPFVLLRKGKDITLNRGMTFEVFTDQDHALNASAAAPPPAPVQPGVPAIQYASAQQRMAAPPPALTVADLATVNIASDIPGAEVEVDGAFIGSTPAVAKLAPGTHRIAVKHGAAVWSRELMVQPGGAANVNAVLRAR